VDFRITGIAFDGGYADYVVAPAAVLARIPDGMSATDAAPLMDAGATTFNALRFSGALPGDLVAVLGIGGLGHLGVQWAAKMGFDTVAIARGADKEPLARQLGARVYIDSRKQDPAAELQRLGGARVVLATVTNAEAMTATLGGLGPNGTLLVVGAPGEPLQVSAGVLIFGRRSVAGWPSGRAVESEDTMRFAVLHGVKPMTELYSLDRAAEAYDRMMSGDARFRVVLTT
jgi:D-arabinose 1-dehydrogenase-like Zn-dependent alcohol dehydrogenase